MKDEIKNLIESLDRYIDGSRKHNTQFAAGGYSVAALVRSKLNYIISK